MKKIIAILYVLGTFIISLAAQAADNPFLSPDWWKKATPQMLEDAIIDGTDVKERDNDGMTPFMRVESNNQNPQVIETLIKLGVDVKAKDGEGKTALDYAKENPNIYRTNAY